MSSLLCASRKRDLSMIRLRAWLQGMSVILASGHPSTHTFPLFFFLVSYKGAIVTQVGELPYVACWGYPGGQLNVFPSKHSR